MSLPAERPGERGTRKTDSLRQQIRELAREYVRIRWPARRFRAGLSPVPYAGRVFGEEEVVAAIEASLDFWLTAGRFSRELEETLADYVGVSHCRLVNSGSSANLVAFSALTSPKLGDRRVRPGDECITVAAGFPTTVAPIIQNQAVPVFVDVDSRTHQVDVERLADALSPRTKAVMVAHGLGNPFPAAEVVEFCNEHELWLVEDNCDALGAEYADSSGSYRRTGSFGHVSTCSFYPAHHITTGEGGAVFTDDDELVTVIESFRDWGRDCYCKPGRSNTCGERFGHCLGELPGGYDHKYTYSHFGYNLKMTDLQAAIGVAQMERLPDFVEARRRNFSFVLERLRPFGEFLQLPEATPRSRPSWFGFLLVAKDASILSRDYLVGELEASHIETRMLFGGNLVRQPCFDEMRRDGYGFRVVGSLVNTDRLMNDAFWFGVFPGMTDEMLDFICITIEGALEKFA